MGVLDILDYFDRPRNMLATGASDLLDPDASALYGMYQGLMGDRHTSWGDIVGIPETDQSDEWGPWAAKGGARLGLDVALDPLNLLFGAGAITKALGLSAKGVSALGRIGQATGATAKLKEAGNLVRGTGLGKMFSHTSGDKAVEDVLYQNMREGSSPILMKQLQDAATQYKGLLPQSLEDIDAFKAIERGTNNPELAKAIEPLLPFVQKKEDLRTAINDLWQKRTGQEQGLIRDLSEEGYTHMPHLMDEASQGFLPGKKLGSMRYDPDVMNEKARQIQNWVDPATGEVVAVGKLKDARTGIKKITDSYVDSGKNVSVEEYWHVPPEFKGKKFDPSDPFVRDAEGNVLAEATRVEKRAADIGDTLRAFPNQALNTEESGLSKLGLITDPSAALSALLPKRQAQFNYLKTLDDLMSQGKIVVSENVPASKGLLDSKYRQLKVPGFEGLNATKPVANRLENLARNIFDPNTPGGMIEEFLSKALDTRAGQGLGNLNKWWKHNILSLFPGYHAGNEISGLQQMYQSGDVNPLATIARQIQGQGVVAGRAGEVAPGMSNEALRQELLARGAIGGESTQTGQMLGDTLDKTLQGESNVRQLFGGNAAGDALATVGEKWGDVNKRAAQWGNRNIEEAQRAGVVIDWIKKNAPDIANRSPEEQAALFDTATRFATNAMVDYSGLTPFERNLSQIIPFYAWNRGIVGNTAELAVTKPQRLANTGRALDTMFTPLSEEDKALADPWIREQGPVRAGWLGQLLQGDPDMMGMLSRFVPQGNLEQLKERPGDFALSSITPWLKTPVEMVANKNAFKDRPIDKVAGGAGLGLLKPFVGGDYEKATSTTFGQELPASWDYLIKQMPGARGLGLVNELGRSAGLYEDPYKDETNPTSGMAWGLTGGKLYPFDTAKYLKRRQTETQAQLRDVTAKRNYAMSRGDFEGMQHYQDILEKMKYKPRAWLEGAS